MIVTRQEIKKIAENLHKQNKKIIFTNGCFDILHRGHIEYLKEAKKLGDVLIIGLNSDDSVKIIKGENRPINSEEDRAEILSQLKPVDFVVIFNEDTPYELIKSIVPDILVKGGDWKTEEIIGSDIVIKNGGKVKSLKYFPNSSTSIIIKKIIAL
ncbi:MAG: D-glycero-beta-D-manno-heptose 1-phosphate adenylyltransferase [Candidatus Cloacimonetes bacterium]|nr:D-glycero-beta-D-manno-heptose 1-phosphate adenylyltransferase [Candidatus Cloacimonadota bacterium]MBL7085569.1 D-glycero-beta-D-manno-heptose 1-phosphate adenylyltransferase [Candidatus Cloacimonadota bacterium]